MDDRALLAAATGAIGLLFAWLFAQRVNSQPAGSQKMEEISEAIHEGAMAFLAREYKALAYFVCLLAVVIYFAIDALTALAFVLGSIFSALAGFVGMKIATRANSRTTVAASGGIHKALYVAFSGGSVMGFTVAGLGILGIGLLYFFMRDPELVRGFALGASSIALFARVGGGIYTKAADVGADLVGKVEAGIPEDDPRNPAVIADNVGDNVGDVAGMGADLFESFVGSIIAAMTLGVVLAGTEYGAGVVVLPMMLAALGLLGSIAGAYFVKTDNPDKIHTTLTNGLIISGFITLCGAWFLVRTLVPTPLMSGPGGLDITSGGIFGAIVSGLVAGMLIGKLTEYYTSYDFAPVKEIASSAQTGSATVIISGLATGMLSTALPVIVIVITIGLAYWMGGLYGIAISAVGMLSTAGMTIAVDAYGPIADNAGGIAEMSEQPPEIREITDRLDSVGNTTAAIGKGFAIGSAALTALALFAAYTQAVGLETIDISEPVVIMGMFVGGLLPFVFGALTMKAVGRAAFSMIEEVRRQFKEHPGIMANTEKPDYARCVDISTAAALKEMIIPGLLAVLAPILTGLYSAEALGGLLAGALVTGVLLAIMMANAGGAWDNAKKYIESGEFGGKGSEAHAAAVVGDTVGDPFKDTSGPSMNILIKLMSIVALVFSALFI